MFEDVAEMEREIETFRKNVVASSELIEGISRLTAETKKQKESFSASTAELLKKLDACVEQFKTDYESALHALKDSNNAEIKALQENMSAEHQARIADLEKIEAALQKNLTDATAQSEAQVKALSETSEAITNAFHQDTEKLQSLSLEQIRQLNTDCERIISEMKSSSEEQQSAYIARLQAAEDVIKGYQASAESKYTEFVTRLESTNVDQIFKEVQDLKKSIQTKFMILAGGIGITLIVAIISLILK